jgi:hypothetical protein
MSTSVTNGSYYLKVKQVATVDADQDVAIKSARSSPTNYASRTSVLFMRLVSSKDRRKPVSVVFFA